MKVFDLSINKNETFTHNVRSTKGTKQYEAISNDKMSRICYYDKGVLTEYESQFFDSQKILEAKIIHQPNGTLKRVEDWTGPRNISPNQLDYSAPPYAVTFNEKGLPKKIVPAVEEARLPFINTVAINRMNAKLAWYKFADTVIESCKSADKKRDPNQLARDQVKAVTGLKII